MTKEEAIKEINKYFPKANIYSVFDFKPHFTIFFEWSKSEYVVGYSEERKAYIISKIEWIKKSFEVMELPK